MLVVLEAHPTLHHAASSRPWKPAAFVEGKQPLHGCCCKRPQLLKPLRTGDTFSEWWTSPKDGAKQLQDEKTKTSETASDTIRLIWECLESALVQLNVFTENI